MFVAQTHAVTVFLCRYLFKVPTLSAGAVEYANCISAEAKTPLMSVLE